MNNNFEGKVAIITGAGSGIGEAAAKMLYQRGANIVLVGRTNKVNKVKKDIKDKRDGILTVQCDLTDENAVESMIEKSVNKFTSIDILINSA